MRDRLKADLTQIGQASRQVSALAEEFGRATELTDVPEPVTGSGQLAGTLQAFTGNWSIHRQRLIDDLRTLSVHTQEAVEAYHGTDESLAAGLRKIMEQR